MTSKKFCPHCGAPLKPGQLFCMSCGERLEHWLSEDEVEAIRAEGERLEAGQAAGDELSSEPTRIIDAEAVHEASERAREAAEAMGEEHVGDEAPVEGHPSHAQHVSPTPSAEPEQPEHLVTGEGYISENPIHPVVPQGHAYVSRHSGDDWETSDNRKLMKILGIAAIVVVVLLALIMHGCFSASDKVAKPDLTKIGADSDSTAVADSASAGSSDSADSASTESDADKQAKQTVKSLYDKLADLDKQVSAAESTFDSTYLNDKDERQSNSDAASTLADTVNQALQAAQSTTVDSSSKYYATYQQVLQCYQDLSDRMSIVTELWKRDLWYNYPQYYTDNILEPKTENTDDGQTDVKPKVDYQTVYAQIKL